MPNQELKSKPEDVEEPREEGSDDSTCYASSDTPETDTARRIDDSRSITGNHVATEFARNLERERDALRKWILAAAPVMEAAICIAIEENVGRLDEIPGCQALMEQCPLEWVRMDHIIQANATCPSTYQKNGPLRISYSRAEIADKLKDWLIELWGDSPKNLVPEQRDQWHRDNGLIFHFICDHFPENADVEARQK